MDTKKIILGRERANMKNRKNVSIDNLLGNVEMVSDIIKKNKKSLKSLLPFELEERKPSVERKPTEERLPSVELTIKVDIPKEKIVKDEIDSIRHVVRNKFYNTSKKTKKYTKNELQFILKTLKKLSNEKKYSYITRKIKTLRRYQVVQLLLHYNIISIQTRAPLPLLKNILFNIVLGGIYIITSNNVISRSASS